MVISRTLKEEPAVKAKSSMDILASRYIPRSFSRAAGKKAMKGRGDSIAASGIQLWKGIEPALAVAPVMSRMKARTLSTESAASGVVGMLLLLVYYGRFKWSVLKESLRDTLRITGMVFMIIAGSQVYSQILSFSGATQGLIAYSTQLNLSPTIVVMLMQVIILIMGCFMDPVGILLITLPIFMPVIRSLGLNEVWFATIMLLNIEMAMITPPFGMCLFIMKGVVGEGATMLEIYKAGSAFIGLQIIIMLIMILFPPVVLWLPSVM